MDIINILSKDRIVSLEQLEEELEGKHNFIIIIISGELKETYYVLKGNRLYQGKDIPENQRRLEKVLNKIKNEEKIYSALWDTSTEALLSKENLSDKKEFLEEMKGEENTEIYLYEARIKSSV